MACLGIRERKVKCQREDDMSTVGDNYCDPTLKPIGIEICYTACPAE